MSDAQEKRTAAKYGGTVSTRSGAGWVRKGDVYTDRFMIENKCKMAPDSKSYSINATVLRDLTKKARMEGRTPILQFDLGGHNYVILVEGDFLELAGVEDE